MDAELWPRGEKENADKSRGVMESDGLGAARPRPSNVPVRSFSGTAAGTGGHFAPRSETWVIAGYFRAEVSFRSRLPRRLSSASQQRDDSHMTNRAIRSGSNV